jgi:signal transduction histidine kinase
MSWFPRSLRNRLVAIAALTTFVVMTGAAAIATWQIRTITDRALSDAARTRLSAVRDGLTPGGQLPSSTRVQRTATYVQVLGADGRVVSASPALRDAPPLLSVAVARRGLHHPRLLNLNQPDLDLAVIAEPATVNAGQGAVIVGVDSQGFLDARDQLRTVVLLGVPLVVVLTGLLTWLVTGRAFRAVTRLAEDADALSVADTGRGLSVHTGDSELGRLVVALNRMLDRLNTHYATNLAAAAETTHRLRTPLATLRAEAELALLDDDPAGARVALERIVADTDRLTGIVDRLLAAAGGHSDVRDLRAAVTEVGGDWQRQAAAHARRATVHCTGIGFVDVTLLRAVTDPLVENAIRHSTSDRPVTVTVDRADGDVRIRVSNHGGGVPAALRDQLFQPWTGRAHGGLGLWLAREAARSAGGDVVCDSYGPPTTTFLARLPAAPSHPTRAQHEGVHR